MHDISAEELAAIASRMLSEIPDMDLAPRTEGDIRKLSDPLASWTTSRPPIGFPSLSTPVMPAVGSPTPESADPRVASRAGDAASGSSLVPDASSSQAPASRVDEDGLKRFVEMVRGAPFNPTPLVPNLESPRRTGASSPTIPAAFAPVEGARPLDVAVIRRDFPVLRQRVHGKPIVWLDNAATTQKPQCVIDALARYYAHDYSNIHRGAHTLAARSTDAYERARKKVQHFLGASSTNEIVFVRGTTEGINLVAQTYGRKFLQPGDEIVLTILEHHANIVPWQMVARERGAAIRVVPVTDRGEIMLEEYQKLLGPRTKLVGLAHANNSLGTLLPVEEMTQMAKRFGARVLVDGAQSVAHVPVNVQQLGADFYVFSGHKIFGPTGIGVVHAREELLEIMPPWQGGGNMIENVTFEETTYALPPGKFEAGTPNIADAIGLGVALDYVSRLGLPQIARHEHELLEYATDKLVRIDGLRLIGTAPEKVGVLSFVLRNRPTEEVGRLLDQEGIAVRAGHHCAQPSLRRFGLDATVRPSLSLYNTRDEIDHLADAVRRLARS